MFPELGMALPVTRIVVNIPLIDFTLENGCTEIWPGSHLIVDPVTIPETEDEVLFRDYHVCSEERGTTLPSLRMVMPAVPWWCGTCGVGIELCLIILTRCVL